MRHPVRVGNLARLTPAALTSATLRAMTAAKTASWACLERSSRSSSPDQLPFTTVISPPPGASAHSVSKMASASAPRREAVKLPAQPWPNGTSSALLGPMTSSPDMSASGRWRP